MIRYLLAGLGIGAAIGAGSAAAVAWLLFQRTLSRVLGGPMPAPRRPPADNSGKF